MKNPLGVASNFFGSFEGLVDLLFGGALCQAQHLRNFTDQQPFRSFQHLALTKCSNKHSANEFGTKLYIFLIDNIVVFDVLFFVASKAHREELDFMLFVLEV